MKRPTYLVQRPAPSPFPQTPPATQPIATVGEVEQLARVLYRAHYEKQPEQTRAACWTHPDAVVFDMDRLDVAHGEYVAMARAATLHTPPPVATATVVDEGAEDRVLIAMQAELSRQADESTAMPYVGERDDDDQILDGSFDLRSLARVAIAATPTPPAGGQ